LIEYVFIEECPPSKGAMGDDQSPLEGITALADSGVMPKNKLLGHEHHYTSHPPVFRSFSAGRLDSDSAFLFIANIWRS